MTRGWVTPRVVGRASTLLWLAVATSAAAADADRGKELFAACAACHTEQPDALGPSLKGIIGRKAGALLEYRYSPAMQRADFTWTEATLRAYLSDPQGVIKGNRMPFSGFSSPADLDDLIAYLRML
jgi:cytochrome c